MLKKEFKDVFKQSLFYVLLALSVPLFIKIAFAKDVGSYFELFFLMVQFSLPLLSAFMGLSLFSGDQRQRAGDYVFSLPYSRFQLLGIKILPRLAAISIFLLLYILLYRWGGEAVSPRGIFTISWLCWSFFLVTIPLSVSTENHLKLGALALLEMSVFLGLCSAAWNAAIQLRGGDTQIFGMNMVSLPDKDSSRYLPLFLLMSACLLLPHLISFVMAFKKRGAHSRANYNRYYAGWFFPLIAAGFILSTIAVYSGWKAPGRLKSYYVTNTYQIVESDIFSTRVYGSGSKLKMKEKIGSFRPFFEEKTYIYGTSIREDTVKISRIDKNGCTVETLYKSGHIPRIDIFNNRIKIFEDIIVIKETPENKQDMMFVFIDSRTKSVKKLRTADVLPKGYRKPAVFAADRENGKRFWLIYSEWKKYPIVRLWEDGKTEVFDMIKGWPGYINHMLVTTTEQTWVFYRITPEGLIIAKKIPRSKDLHLRPWNSFADLTHRSYQKEVLVTRHGNKEYFFPQGPGGNYEEYYFSLNLKTFEASPEKKIPAAVPFFIYRTPGNDYYIIEYEGERRWSRRLKKIYRLVDGEFRLLKTFPPDKTELYQAQFSPFYRSTGSGIVIKQNNGIAIYSLPDLQPLKFKGVN